MKALRNILINITIAALIIFTTYRVVMNNLTIDEVKDNNIIISVFGLVDEYIVDDEPTVYYRDAGSHQLYSPIPDGVTVEQLYRIKSHPDDLIAWMDETEIDYTVSNDFIIAWLEDVEIDRLIESAINCSCLMKVEGDVATITNRKFFPFLGESWSLEGVQPLTMK